MSQDRPALIETGLFAAAAFLSALLLFSVQPMVARMILPLLGGAPAVWNTCLLFFQLLLLSGYAYSHWLSGRTAFAQRWIQLALLVAAILVLPIALPQTSSAAPAGNPASWLLSALLMMVGLPFFALSAHAPLFQVWLARRKRDPYFLYSASNAGSLLALAAYPTLIEPAFGLSMQSTLWMAGFALLIPLVWLVSARTNREPISETAEANVQKPTGARRFLWMALAFVPSSLLQGVTTYVTTDLASLPLLWVIPLALYLMTFVVAFSEQRQITLPRLERPLAVGGAALILLMAMEAVEPVWLVLGTHLIFFTIACLYCHLRLAESKPNPRRLTEFYLWISVGGALGGAFNALLAPVIFDTVAEYPIAIVLALLTRCQGWPGTSRQRATDLAVPIGIATIAAVAAILLPIIRTKIGFPVAPIFLGILAAATFFMMHRPVRNALALGAMLAGGVIYSDVKGRILHTERSFFGVLRVTYDPAGPFHRLWHGTTIHGVQFIAGNEMCEPLGYYVRESGLGLAWDLARQTRAITNVAVIGLGAGSSLVYGEPTQKWTIYEIDPAVVRLASDTNWFSYINGCARSKLEFAIGDARLKIADAAPAQFDFMILDAFSSDTVPMHLMTREAMRLYAGKLAPGGFIVFHVSSRNLRLKPVVSAVSEAEGLACFEPAKAMAGDDRKGRFEADWLVVARLSEAPAELGDSEKWRRLRPAIDDPVWSDDFCDLWSVIDLR